MRTGNRLRRSLLPGRYRDDCRGFATLRRKTVFRAQPPVLFQDDCVGIEDLEDNGLTELARQIEDTEDTRRCIALIEQFLLHRLCDREDYNCRRLAAVVRRIETRLSQSNRNGRRRLPERAAILTHLLRERRHLAQRFLAYHQGTTGYLYVSRIS